MSSQLDNAWENLHEEGQRLAGVTISELFEDAPTRFDKFSFSLDDLLIDFSKERIDEQALNSLFLLAKAAKIENRREDMFSGANINTTEDRAVLHVALRGGVNNPVEVAGQSVMDDIKDVQEKFLSFAEDVRNGDYTAVNGAPFTDVVNIGIGGSDLGPCMAVRALTPDADGPRMHFVSNIDGSHLRDILSELDPQRTLIIIASKTFTTLETMTNARSAQAWLKKALGKHTGQHLAAISTNIEATSEFGISTDNVFGFWDWVGGRYSIWSAIGLPLAIAIGEYRYRRFLQGAASMDHHFQSAPMEKNLPILLALIGIWRRNIMGCQSVAVIPYDQRLERFPAYLQQMDMESNGKYITREGERVQHQTSPVIWGEPGTNSQHSFFQLIHQGTDIIPVDFIVAAQARDGIGGHHSLLLANCLAQGQALAFGKNEQQVRNEMIQQGIKQEKIDALAPHRTFPGNRPSTTILHETMKAFNLGRLIALYEHKVFVQGLIWGVNSFDQWGVELGKQLAPPLALAVQGLQGAPEELDVSTSRLLDKIIELGVDADA
jgi:glucose-6-phosphate isomerase